MAIRFIVGRAGSGKTHHCLEAIRARLTQDPVDGPRLILLVPEQASMQMERAILESPAGGDVANVASAAHRADVLSFERLAFRVLDSTGSSQRRALSDSARTMVIRHLIGDELSYYAPMVNKGSSGRRLGGFVERISSTIVELIQEGISPDELLAVVVDESTRGGGEATQSAAKLRDIALVYHAYIDYLGDNKLDPSQRLAEARQHLGANFWLRGAEVWVDGFASFGGEELKMLAALSAECQSVDITMMADPIACRAELSRSANGSEPDAAIDDGLFARTVRTYRELRDALAGAGLEIVDPLELTTDSPSRFDATPALSRLERTLFVASGEAGGDGGLSGVELVELPSARLEVDYAVSRICRWVRDEPNRYRYRDVAIIARDLEPYYDLLSHALMARDIPFFIDRRRSVAHHPMVELLRAGFLIAADHMSLDSVRLLLKTGLLGIKNDDADRLENYLLEHGIGGNDRWSGKRWTYVSARSDGPRRRDVGRQEDDALDRVNATREIVCSHTAEWKAFAGEAVGHTGQQWYRAMLDWIDRLGVAKTLARWTREAEADGELDQAEEHRQVWRDTMSLLDDLAFAFSDVQMTLHEISDVLDAGLSQLTLGLVPPMVDQVLVGSIERSRHPDIKAAVVIGFHDGAFPTRVVEDSILNDEDRERMREAGLRVRPPARERVCDEELLAYVALTRASHSLVVTYASADEKGKSRTASPYVRAISAACGGLESTRVLDPAKTGETWDLLSARDLTSRLVSQFRGDFDLAATGLRERRNSMYVAVREDMSLDSVSRRATALLDECVEARISPRRVELFVGEGPLRASVSSLELYAACPFKHFAEKTLGLRERKESSLAPTDIGTLYHEILEEFVGSLVCGEREFSSLDESGLLDALEESCAKVAMRLPKSGSMSDSRSVYVMRRSAAALSRVLQVQQRRDSLGSAKPRRVEVAFGFDREGGVPAMAIDTPQGRRVELRGVIDRVDLVELADEYLGIVIDYKRTHDKTLKLDQVYHGLSLQLLGYLLVLEAAGETLAGRPIRPIGAMYVSLKGQYCSVEHPSKIPSRKAGLQGTAFPAGLLLADEFDALDSTLETKWSTGFRMYRRKDGSFGDVDRSDTADAAEFGGLLAHTKRRMGELADGILDGDVNVRPYRLGNASPCTWCKMTSVCHFEMVGSQTRFLDSLKRSEVFRRLADGDGR